jgi:hypothetical protein
MSDDNAPRPMDRPIDRDTLLALASRPHGPCDCELAGCTGWDSVAAHRWPADTLARLGTLRDPDLAEPTFAEHHPAGTRLESPEAPLALRHYPCNRADVFACQRCQGLVLRYDETGGYYFDIRARRVAAARIVDPDPAAD